MSAYNNSMSQTPAVTNLLIANVVAYLATMMLNTSKMYGLFALFPVESFFFEWWQPVTYMFLHGGFSHLFFNMFALWMFGRGLEMEMGTKRFLIYYFVCGVEAALVQLGMAEVDIMNMRFNEDEAKVAELMADRPEVMKFVQDIQKEVNAQRGNKLPVSPALQLK